VPIISVGQKENPEMFKYAVSLIKKGIKKTCQARDTDGSWDEAISKDYFKDNMEKTALGTEVESWASVGMGLKTTACAFLLGYKKKLKNNKDIFYVDLLCNMNNPNFTAAGCRLYKPKTNEMWLSLVSYCKKNNIAVIALRASDHALAEAYYRKRLGFEYEYYASSTDKRSKGYPYLEGVDSLPYSQQIKRAERQLDRAGEWYRQENRKGYEKDIIGDGIWMSVKVEDLESKVSREAWGTRPILRGSSPKTTLFWGDFVASSQIRRGPGPGPGPVRRRRKRRRVNPYSRFI